MSTRQKGVVHPISERQKTLDSDHRKFMTSKGVDMWNKAHCFTDSHYDSNRRINDPKLRVEAGKKCILIRMSLPEDMRMRNGAIPTTTQCEDLTRQLNSNEAWDEAGRLAILAAFNPSSPEYKPRYARPKPPTKAELLAELAAIKAQLAAQKGAA